MEYTIPAARTQANDVIELRLRVTPARSWRNLFRTASIVRLLDLSIAAAELECTGVQLPASMPVAFDAIARGCLAEGTLMNEEERGAYIPGGLAILRFRFPAATVQPQFQLRFGRFQPHGWLLVKWNDRLLFDGEIGPDAEAVFDCPAELDEPINTVDLAISFAPGDEFEDNRIAILSVRQTSGGMTRIGAPAPPEEGRRSVVLSTGRQVIPAKDDVSRRIFTHGWTLDAHDGAVVRDTTAMIEFVLSPEPRGEARLVLDLVPLRDATGDGGDNPVVSVGLADKPVAQFNLAGPYRLEIPIARNGGLPGNAVRVSVHVVCISADGAQSPRPASLSVTRIGLMAEKPPAAPRRETPSAPAHGSFHAAITAAARMAREEAEKGLTEDATEDFLRRHEDLVKAFRRLGRTAVAPTVAHPGVPADLAEIGRCFRSVRPAGALVADGNPFDPAGEEAVRNFALAMLTRPAWRCGGAEMLDAAPPLAAAFPEAVAAWLAETPPATAGEAELTGYCAHLTALYRGCRNLLQREYAGSRYFVLAEKTFRRIRPDRLLSTHLNLRALAVAEGEARRTLLQVSGSGPVYAPPPAGPGKRMRLAVLAKAIASGPESRILFAMYRGLDKPRFHTTLYVVEAAETAPPEGIFDDIVCLDDLAADQGVATIRAGGHDVLMLGGFPGEHGPLAEIAAHRLARIQVATTAVCPRTTGLASFDIMLSSRLTEPENAQEHYSEALHLWNAPVHCVDIGDAAPKAGKSPSLRKRQAFGVGADRVLLASGVTAARIGDDLATAWAQILARHPQTTLVLYSVPGNRRRAHGRARFQQELTRIFEANGASADQLMILDGLSDGEVRDLLAASDLYLDSFPCAGATSVAEALHSGVPVVSLSGSTQRGLQGVGLLRAYRLEEGAADSIDGYVSLASKLAGDRDARSAYRQRILASLAERGDLDDPASFGKRFSSWLWEIAMPEPYGPSSPGAGYGLRVEPTAVA